MTTNAAIKVNITQLFSLWPHEELNVTPELVKFENGKHIKKFITKFAGIIYEVTKDDKNFFVIVFNDLDESQLLHLKKNPLYYDSICYDKTDIITIINELTKK